MPRYELKKSIEVTKLNRRTGIPTGDPAATIPFGSIIENPELDYEHGKFTFLGQLYRCGSEVLKAAMESHPVGAAPAPPAAPPAPAAAPAATAASPAAAAEPAASSTEVSGLQWEKLGSSPHLVWRTKVPGGWLVTVDQSVAFYPDTDHQWDGTSLA
jgi:hypothetical protein